MIGGLPLAPGMPISSDSKAPAGSPSQIVPIGIFRWVAVLAITALGLSLRLTCLTCKPFWFDEAFSVEVARVTLPNFLHLLWWREANMSLYYVLLRIWLWIGHSPFFIRSLSAVVASGTIPAIYWLGLLLFDRRVALIAAALFAFNGYDVRYAQEARSYALFVILATLSSGFLIAYLREPTRRSRTAYIVCSVLAVYAHFYALLLIGAHWIAVRWRAKPAENNEFEVSTYSQLRRAWIVIGIAVLPLLIFVAKTGAGPLKWIHRPGLRDLAMFSIYFTDGRPLIYFSGCLLTLISLQKNLFKRTRQWEKWRVHFLFIWLLFPIVLTVLLSFARPVFLPRYMIFCIPALVLLVAAGLASMRPAWLSAVLVFGLLLLSAQFVPFVYSHDFDEERDASVAAANLLLDHAQADDAVIFHIAETRIPYEFARSLRSGANTANPSFKARLGPEIVFPNHGPGLDYRDFTGRPTSDFLHRQLGRHSRVWVMLMNNGGVEKPDPTTIMLSQILPEMFAKMQRWQLAKVEIRLYSKE
jgi:4-amino-4-deoxy-L-arabinose transferase-like glycosyltransferase